VTTESKAPSVADLVDPAYFNRGYSVYEPGLYLSTDRNVAEIYSTDDAVLDIRLNVKNTKIYSQETAYKSSLENYRLTNGLQLSDNAGERNFAGIGLSQSYLEDGTRLYLHNLIFLSDIILSGVDLSAYNLSLINLQGAQLVGTQLWRTSLSGADLSGADLTGANLDSARLLKTNLRGAKLIGANLTEAQLIDTDLTGADLSESILCQVNLSKIKLDEECHRQVLCTKALLWRTHLPDGTFIDSAKYHH
jgi:uncharacterized protein YjbI with pentapeptide repeats